MSLSPFWNAVRSSRTPFACYYSNLSQNGSGSMHTRRNTDMSTNMLWFSAYYSQCRWGHTVRIILKEDLPHNKGYAGDVISVRAGYARNCLIPTKKAVYAVPANFQKLNISDPDENTQKERQVEFGSTGGGQERKEDNDDKKAADLLKKYLSNKTLTIWREADLSTGRISPGVVTPRNVKQKLSKQLKIDLDPDEHITLFPEQVTYNEIGDIDLYLQNRLRRHRGKLSAPQEGGTDEREVLRSELDEWDGETTERTRVDYAGVEDLTKVQIKQLGEYVASVNVVGDHCVPLRVSVVKRR